MHIYNYNSFSTYICTTFNATELRLRISKNPRWNASWERKQKPFLNRVSPEQTEKAKISLKNL